MGSERQGPSQRIRGLRRCWSLHRGWCASTLSDGDADAVRSTGSKAVLSRAPVPGAVDLQGLSNSGEHRFDPRSIDGLDPEQGALQEELCLKENKGFIYVAVPDADEMLEEGGGAGSGVCQYASLIS